MPRTITAELRVDAPVEAVWPVATDVAAAAPYLPGCTGIELLTPPPFAAGTRWLETRVILRRPATMELLVTASRAPGAAPSRLPDAPPDDWGTPPGAAYYDNAWSHADTRYTSRFEMVPDGRGTRLVMKMRAAPRTLFGRLLSAATSGVLRKILAADLEGLARAVRERHAAPTGPARV